MKENTNLQKCKEKNVKLCNRKITQTNGKNCQYENGKNANGKHMEGNKIRKKVKDTIPNEK